MRDDRPSFARRLGQQFNRELRAARQQERRMLRQQRRADGRELRQNWPKLLAHIRSRASANWTAFTSFLWLGFGALLALLGAFGIVLSLWMLATGRNRFDDGNLVNRGLAAPVVLGGGFLFWIGSIIIAPLWRRTSLFEFIGEDGDKRVPLVTLVVLIAGALAMVAALLYALNAIGKMGRR